MMKMKVLTAVAALFALAPLAPLAAVADEELPANSTEPMGQTFAEPRPEETLRVLIVGAGDHHHFPRYFLKQDSETLREAGGIDTAATPNLEEALELLPQADVLVFSGNHGQWGSSAFQEALTEHADAGKGVVLVHAATWVHPWSGGSYNDRFVAGGSQGHGHGDFEVNVDRPDHPVMEGVPETFEIHDESYYHNFRDGADVEVLATNGEGAREHASVWVVNDPETRIVCITLGHDGRAHGNPAYQAILTNAVVWVAGADEDGA